MEGRLEGRTALVTGGARGIGRAIGERFAAEGARLALADIDEAGVRRTAGEVGAGAVALAMDVADPESCHEGVRQAIDALDALDVLVNNAGYLRHTTAFDCTEDDWDRMMDINLKGSFFCSQAALPHMRDRRRGVILNLSSLAAKTGGVAASPPYGAAKAGVSALTLHLARVMAPYGVRVNALAPGIIDTDMTRDLSGGHAELARRIPLGSRGRAEDVANLALFLASDEASHITGEVVDVNGGLWMD